MKVTVCVITYHRLEGLKRLLNGLNLLEFTKSDPPSLDVVVVDNDANGSACTFCESPELNLKWPLKCYIEPQRGISYARNKAIACVANDVDFVAFIDDDEVPEPYWLDELLYIQKTYNADVVSGLVKPYFHEDIPDWIIKGEFFEKVPRYPTGHQLKVAATNNVLIRYEIFRSMDKIFDERFALTGAEDTHFFMRVYHAGYKIVRSDEALVYEWIPKSRTNERWILQRAYRAGNTFSLCELEFEPSIVVGFMRVAKGAGRIIQGFLLIPLSVIAGRHAFIKALQHIFFGAGTLAGVAGQRYEEYRVTHQV